MHVRIAILSLTLVGVAALAPQSRAEALPEASPFLPPAGAAPAAAATDAGFDLVGMTILGRETLVSVLRHADHRSLWIPVGRTVGDITVVSYSAGKDEAVIRVGGRELTLPMRKGGVVAGANLAGLLPAPITTGAPASAPGFAVPSKPLSPTEEKEMEARMLVSDLLEIGQQQRKAYEEAQRRAAAAKTAKAAAPQPASQPAPPPSPTPPSPAAPSTSPAPADTAANPPTAQ